MTAISARAAQLCPSRRNRLVTPHRRSEGPRRPGQSAGPLPRLDRSLRRRMDERPPPDPDPPGSPCPPDGAPPVARLAPYITPDPWAYDRPVEKTERNATGELKRLTVVMWVS